MSLFQKSLEVMQGHGNLRRRERNDMDKTTSKKDSPEKNTKMKLTITCFSIDCHETKCIKSILKKRLESKLRRKYVLNLLNEPQHLAKIKTPKLLMIPNKGATNFREQ